ncbi:hypothetical protein M6B38_117515 [Iris pallida]|uniref:Uncharacterized protein n=1 Tax=Iris pallida TaxID=29817 RepID=A0AAX6HRS8_IRIPA|nr:hypothetical protein M6B38_382865 [Iris pallida]KAJ6843786.1 hypothetical protein M6B38_117515 [Iris pallida]
MEDQHGERVSGGARWRCCVRRSALTRWCSFPRSARTMVLDFQLATRRQVWLGHVGRSKDVRPFSHGGSPATTWSERLGSGPSFLCTLDCLLVPSSFCVHFGHKNLYCC